jgi:hypothetical protein
MNRKLSKLLLSGACAMALSAPAFAGNYVHFDVPNAGYTGPVAINAKGTVAGTWQDNSTFASHGFLRSPDGTIATFDPAGSVDTEVRGMSGKGAVVGRYQDSSFNVHGFIRKPNGKIIELVKNGIIAADSINAAGDICGLLADDQHISHAFVRTADGKVTQIDPPGAVRGEAVGIDNTGTVAGWFADNGNEQHGFVRVADGTLAVFDPPDSHDTYVFAINANGAIAGAYNDASGIPNGFIRDASGSITEFTLTQETGAFTYNFGINDRGAVAGAFYEPVEDTSVAFERKPGGRIVKLKPAKSAPAIAGAINIHGVITGSYDVSGTVHGFLGTP